MSLAYIDDKARVGGVRYGHLTTFLFRPDLDAWLRDVDALFVEVRCDFDCCIAFYACDGFFNSLLYVLMIVRFYLLALLLVHLVHDDLGLGDHLVALMHALLDGAAFRNFRPVLAAQRILASHLWLLIRGECGSRLIRKVELVALVDQSLLLIGGHLDADVQLGIHPLLSRAA